MWNWARLAVLVYPKSSQGFLHTFSMALYHKWDVKKCLCLCTSILSLISGGLGGVHNHKALSSIWKKIWGPNVLLLLNYRKKKCTDRVSIFYRCRGFDTEIRVYFPLESLCTFPTGVSKCYTRWTPATGFSLSSPSRITTKEFMNVRSTRIHIELSSFTFL